MAEFNFARYQAFGWVIHRKSLDTGETFRVAIPHAYNVEDAENISLWTRGRVTGFDEISGAIAPEKTPGCSILKQHHVCASDILYIAEEPSEFWCINYKINRLRRPKVHLVDLLPGQMYSVHAGETHNLLICSGSLEYNQQKYDAPATFSLSTSITATSRVLGFRFLD